MSEGFKQVIRIESPSDGRKKFESQLNNLLLSGAPLLEIAEILGAKEYVEGDAKRGVKLRVRDFALAQFGEEVSSNMEPVTDLQEKIPVRLPEKFLKLNTPILPPGEGQLETGSGTGFEEKKLFPRNKEFIRLLTELEEVYQIISGTNTNQMMRGETYRIFLLPNRQKLVFINDEEGNATFVVHGATKDEWQDYTILTKDQLKELPEKLLETIVYPGTIEEWKIMMREAVTRVTENVEDQSETEIKKAENVLDSKEEETETLQEMKVGRAPDGWMLKRKLADLFGVSYETLNKELVVYAGKNPEWFQTFKSENGKELEHYHPDLIKKIEEKFLERRKAPEGWMTRGKIAKGLLSVNNSTVGDIAEKYRFSHPEWFQEYYFKASRGGRKTEHYHPELVRLIIAEIKSRPDVAPDGWLTRKGLARLLEVSPETIRKSLDNYATSHPEWFQEYRDQGGFVTHYHPDLVSKVKVDIEQSTMPAEWVNESELQQMLGIDRRRISIYLNENPDKSQLLKWKRQYRGKGGSVIGYHPDAVNFIKKVIGNLPDKVPVGWLPAYSSYRKAGTSRATFHKLADALKNLNPALYMTSRNSQGQTHEYYSPEFVSKLEEMEKLRKEGKLKSKN